MSLFWGMVPPSPAVFCGNSMSTCTQHRRLWIWIYPWISMQKSVDMDIDMDGKFHIHGKHGYIGIYTPPPPKKISPSKLFMG